MPPPDHLEAHRVAYVDETRSHEVLTDVESVPEGLRFVVMETPFGSRDPGDVVTREETLTAPWEIQLAIRELETRLVASGIRYFRVGGGGRDVAPVPFASRARLDYAPREMVLDADDGLRVQVNHYHEGRDGSRLQLAVPRVDLREERFALAELAFKFPDVGGGRFSLVHGRLSPGTLRHRWVDTCLDLSRAGYRKLITESDYAAAFGADWQDAWRDAWRIALDRFLEADFTESEDAPAAPAREDPPEDPRTLLKDPTLAALRRMYLTPDTHARLVKDGPFPIRRFIAGVRRRVAHDKQHGLSLLEAALLTEHALRRGRIELLQEEGTRLARVLRDYARARA